jgi:hypothetical protein
MATRTPAKTGIKSLIRQAMDRVESGEMSLLDAIRGIGKVPDAPPTEVVRVAPITEEQHAALAELPKVYGVVAPKSRRLLRGGELRDLARERKVIDTILALIKERKEVGIRETVLAHHDLAAERDHGAGPDTPTDKNGHYLVKDVQYPVPELDLAWVPQVSDGEVTISADLLHAAMKAGLISRETYMQITRPAKREFDEVAARAAIREDPELLLVIAEHTVVQGRGKVSLYLRGDKGRR